MRAVRIKTTTIISICAMAWVSAVPRVAGAADLPDGITPSHVYAAMDQVNRTLDVLLKATQRKAPPAPKSFETGVLPMHVYRMAVTCANRSGQALSLAGGEAPPLLTIQPRNYAPKDVLEVAQATLANLKKYAQASQITGLPEDRAAFEGKTPSDVFKISLKVFIKTSVLAGKAKISPNEVYAQVTVAATDAEAILKASGASYNTDAPAPDPKLKPKDVFFKSLDARKAINAVKAAHSLAETPVPTIPADYKVRPIDVFVQAQILQAEMNLLKMATQTPDASPAPIKVSDKRPANVWGQVALTEFLVKQIPSSASASAAE